MSTFKINFLLFLLEYLRYARTHSIGGKMPNLVINNFTLYYEIHGEGPPLLLLHGFTGSGVGLAAAFHAFSLNYKLIIPDLRGHGRSTNPSKEFTFRQTAQDILALLEHLDIDQCAAIGFSGGGCALLHMAYRQPEKIKSMALVSAAPYFPAETRAIMKEITVEGKTEDEWAAMRAIHFHGDEQIKILWEQSRMFSESYIDMNFTPEMLSQITTKTLIIQGDRDPFYPIELTLEMYKPMQNAYLWIVPNGGHVPITADSLEGFINNVSQIVLRGADI